MQHAARKASRARRPTCIPSRRCGGRLLAAAHDDQVALHGRARAEDSRAVRGCRVPEVALVGVHVHQPQVAWQLLQRRSVRRVALPAQHLHGQAATS